MYLIKSLTDEMPSWHNQPLHLSVVQMEEPMTVYKDFFEIYSLPNIRYCLKEWLHDALHNNEANALDTVTVYHDTLQLIEAAWLLHQQQLKRIAPKTTLK